MERPAINPGEHLRDQLDELNMSAAELVHQIGISTQTVQAILGGQAAITGDTALCFGYFFVTSAGFWINIQKLYELRLAEHEVGELFKMLPKLSDYRAGWDNNLAARTP